MNQLIYEAFTFGNPSVVTGVDSNTGQTLWSTPLETIDGHNELVWVDVAATSADGSMVYFNTRFTSNGEPGAVYAIHTLDAAGCAADYNGDGELNILDFVDLQSDAVAGNDNADINGDGEINVLDFVAFQELFVLGCP